MASLEKNQASHSTAPQGLQPSQPSQPSDLPSPFLCLSACFLCLVLVVIEGGRCFVTREDAMFCWSVVFYMCVCFYSWVLVRAFRSEINEYMPGLSAQISDRDPPFYNPLAGVLQPVASRLYAGAETPYNPPLVFIVAVRALIKCRRRVDLIRCVTLVLDACCVRACVRVSAYLVRERQAHTRTHSHTHFEKEKPRTSNI